MQGRPFTAKSVTVAAAPRMVQAAGDPSRRGRRAARTPRKRPGGCLAYGLFICGHVGVSASGRHSFAAALWTIYKGTSIGVLMVLAHLIERGEYPELPEIITRQGREDSVAAALNGVGGVAALAAIARNCQSGALRAPIRAPVRPIGRYVQRRRDPDGR